MSIGAILNKETTIDVVDEVASGNMNPVTSNVVYNAIQESQSTGLNWTFLASGTNTVTYTVPDNAQMVKFVFEGNIEKIGSLNITLNFEKIHSISTALVGIVNTNTSLTVNDFNGYLIGTVTKTIEKGGYIILRALFGESSCLFGEVGQSQTAYISGDLDDHFDLDIKIYYI